MYETCTKSVETARAEAMRISKGHKAGVKFCMIVIGVVLLGALFFMEFESAIIFDVMLLIIGVIATVPVSSQYTALNKSIEKNAPVICKALGTGYERMGKRSVPAVYFEFEGSKGWAVIYEEKNAHKITEGDALYVWHNNQKKRMYLAIYAGEPLLMGDTVSQD